MVQESMRQESFIHLIPIEANAPLFGERSVTDALTEDFPATIQKIRQIYLPKKSVLLAHKHLLGRAIEISDGLGSLYDVGSLADNPKNFPLFANLETLRRRDILLDRSMHYPHHSKVAHQVDSLEWENDIRMATDDIYYRYRTAMPEDKPKRTVSWTGASTEAICQISNLFYPNPSADQADMISGEDRLTAELFSHYFTFLKKKELIANSLIN